MTTVSNIKLNEVLSIPYVDNFYSETELVDIMYELKFLVKNNKLKPPMQTGSANQDYLPIKRNNGLFLDEVYKDRNVSDILRNNRKIFQVKIASAFPCMKAIEYSNTDVTLISYYEDSDYYKSHIDISVITVLSYFYEAPKAFQGGDLYLPEYDVTLPCVNNRIYFLPSLIEHEVVPITMDEKDMGKGLGRYCMSQFLSFK